MDIIKDDFAAIFHNEDDLISKVISKAEDLSKVHKSESVRLNGQIGKLENQINNYMVMTADPEMIDARRTITRKIGELELERDQIFAAMGKLTIEASETTEKLASAVRMALGEAKRSLASIKTPAEFNRFVARFVGSFSVGMDGSVSEGKPVECQSHPTGEVAGGGFEPPTSGL